MVTQYIPSRGDVIMVSFNPKTGHEQAGVRPALVLSPQKYNAKTNMAIVCPITNSMKGYPFEVMIPSCSHVTGVVLADQVKCIDWVARKATFFCVLPNAVVSEVIQKLQTLFT